MKSQRKLHRRATLLIGLLGGACAADAPISVGSIGSVGESSESSEALRSLRPRRVQPGENLTLLAVSADDYAIYQEGQTVYASKLVPGAERTFVADVPGTNVAFPLQVGDVVFVWTNPQRQLPGFGVSPLILWTSDRGPRLISSQSAVALVATAASTDSRQIVFTTNATADGLRGDLVYARTRDALAPTLLLRDIPLDFPFGTCRPLAAFAGEGDDSFPIAEYCAGVDTTATMSTWSHGKKRDLIHGIATPLPFFFGGDPQGRTFLVNLADQTVATVTTSGHVQVIDSAAVVSAGFITRRGTVGYVARGAAGQPSNLRLAIREQLPPRTVGPAAGLLVERVNRGGYGIRQTTSLDGSMALYTTKVDPNTGLDDMNLVDLRTGASTVLDPGAAFFGNELYTSDSSEALYYFFPDPNAFTGALFAADLAGKHQVSASADVFDALRAAGSVVSYSEHPIFDFTQFSASTADLVVADAADPSVPPRVVSEQANLFYFPAHDRRGLAFTSEIEAEGPGLYSASARP